MKLLTLLACRLVAALRYVLMGEALPEQPRLAARVGLLDSGELIVMPAAGGHLVLSADTTEQVRQVLAHDEAAATLRVPLKEGVHLGGGVMLCTTPAGATTGVHP